MDFYPELGARRDEDCSDYQYKADERINCILIHRTSAQISTSETLVSTPKNSIFQKGYIFYFLNMTLVIYVNILLKVKYCSLIRT